MVGTTYTRELPLLDKSEWVMCLWVGGGREEGREGGEGRGKKLKSSGEGGMGWGNRELFDFFLFLFLFLFFCVCLLHRQNYTLLNQGGDGKAHSAKKIIKIKMVLVKGHSL